ncbi:MAG: hypothetical protein LPK46_11315 [Bacteroidota bacterium]|nr:hypothetical protein [Bacteroidota bacterium]MDX5506714.1 hypothetical protein [Bacteroidota bacterium]
MKPLILLFLFSVLLSCSSTVNEKSSLSGKWTMYQVIQDGQDVTSDHDPFKERYLILKDDSTFESGGRPYGENSGKYAYSSVDHLLFLDSDAGPEDDSQWKVSLSGDTMHWQGVGSEWAKGFELIQIKEKK